MTDGSAAAKLETRLSRLRHHEGQRGGSGMDGGEATLGQRGDSWGEHTACSVVWRPFQVLGFYCD